MTSTRTRSSFGSQLRSALDDAQARGLIALWTTYVEDGRTFYCVEATLRTPGEMADWLNERGYDVRFGA